MPTYEYRCRDCGHEFEIVQSMKDDALTVCPECGGVLRKVFGAPMISFKGSGFYATDHGKKSKSAERASEQKEGKSADGDASSKPAASGDKATSDKKSDGAATAASEKTGSTPAPKSEPKSEPKTASKKESTS